MTAAMKTVSAFYEAFGTKDWKKLRSLITDDFTFRGALSTFNGPAEFIAGMSRMPFEGVPEASRFIVDGNRVAHAFVWKMTAPARAAIPMCEVLEVEGGRVRSSDLFFDSKLFPTPG